VGSVAACACGACVLEAEDFRPAWVGQASDGVASTVRGRFHFSVGLVAGPRLGPRIAAGFMHTHASHQVQVPTVPQGFLGGFPEAIKRSQSVIPSDRN
jgi:hypothetical protein